MLAEAIPVPFPKHRDTADAERLQVGATEQGTPWFLRLLGRHVLVAGPRARQGLGRLVDPHGAGPSVKSGVVELWVIDPKVGWNSAGAPLFARFAHDAGEDTVHLLQDAAAVLTARAARLRGVTRLHTPTADEPLIVVVIDEIATLTAYTGDRKIRAEIEQLLGLILSQGRAVGFSVIAAVQDPSKDVLAMRQLFPTRIALRLSEPSQVAMVLGEAAETGAGCAIRFPTAFPGSGTSHTTAPPNSNGSGFPRHRPRHRTALPRVRPHGSATRLCRDGRLGDRGMRRPGMSPVEALSTRAPSSCRRDLRAASLGYEEWWARVAEAGFCAVPLHLGGRDEGGKRVEVMGRCKNRRASVCPSCSQLYAGDTWQLVDAALRPGRRIASFHRPAADRVRDLDRTQASGRSTVLTGDRSTARVAAIRQAGPTVYPWPFLICRLTHDPPTTPSANPSASIVTTTAATSCSTGTHPSCGTASALRCAASSPGGTATPASTEGRAGLLREDRRDAAKKAS